MIERKHAWASDPQDKGRGIIHGSHVLCTCNSGHSTQQLSCTCMHDLCTCMSFTRTCMSHMRCMSHPFLATAVKHSTMDIDSIVQCLQHDMQQMALTIYAVPVPPANQGRVTRNTEYDVSRAPKATAIQIMRASAVQVHIRSAGLCLFSLGRGGTRHAARARLMAWASMAPLCSHHSCIHSLNQITLFQLLCARLTVDLAHDTRARYAKFMRMLCRRGGRLQNAKNLKTFRI